MSTLLFLGPIGTSEILLIAFIEKEIDKGLDADSSKDISMSEKK